MKRIVITGPESSGKTTLCQALAQAFDAPWTPEYAREYLELLPRAYREEDLLRMAREQWRRQQELMQQESSFFIFCDTGLLVLYIWAAVRFASVDPWIKEKLHNEPADLYLLCRPNIPWESDPLRENPNDRELLFLRYEQTAKELGLPYETITGDSRQQRLAQAIHHLEHWYPNKN